jgi:hypothetical protein
MLESLDRYRCKFNHQFQVILVSKQSYEWLHFNLEKLLR